MDAGFFYAQPAWAKSGATGRLLLTGNSSMMDLRRKEASPGSGFFNLARSLGRLSGTDEAGETRFYVREFERVLAYWQGTEPS
jgi:hypothetical protein